MSSTERSPEIAGSVSGFWIKLAAVANQTAADEPDGRGRPACGLPGRWSRERHRDPPAPQEHRRRRAGWWRDSGRDCPVLGVSHPPGDAAAGLGVPTGRKPLLAHLAGDGQQTHGPASRGRKGPALVFTL